MTSFAKVLADITPTICSHAHRAEITDSHGSRRHGLEHDRHLASFREVRFVRRAIQRQRPYTSSFCGRPLAGIILLQALTPHFAIELHKSVLTLAHEIDIGHTRDRKRGAWISDLQKKDGCLNLP